jgi:hypothetical protein
MALEETPQGSTDPVLEGSQLDDDNAGEGGSHTDGADVAADTQLEEQLAENEAADADDSATVDKRMEGSG